MFNTANFSDLAGLTLVNITKGKNSDGNDSILFESKDGRKFEMFHHQSCCENVYIEDICGDLYDLLNTEVLIAEERTEHGNPEYGTQTWTFYVLSTIKGTVTIRWNGSSNGYYSESVYFEKVVDDDDEYE